MKKAREIKEHLLPWSGFIAVLAGWALTHQIGSNTSFDRCQWTSPAPMVILGIIGIAILAAGAFFSHKVWKRGDAETQPRRFLGLLGAGMCALFGVALIFQTISSLIIPQCYG